MTARPPHLAARAAAAATVEQVAAYQRDGAVCLRGLLDAIEVTRLRRGIDANLAAPSPRAIVASRPKDPGFFIEDFCNWQRNADYRATAVDTPLPDVAARLMQSRCVRLYHDHMLTKQAGTRAQQPVLGWALEPGDLVAFHMLSLHASAGAQQQRRVFSLRYTGDDVTHAPRRWKTSPDFPGLADELPPDAPLQHPLFPLIVDGR